MNTQLTREAGAQLGPVVRDDVSAHFFDGTRAGSLLLRRSPQSGDYLDPRVEEGEWVAASGTGTVVSWTAVHGKDAAGEPTRVTLGIVQLTEGPWWWCQLTGVDPDADLLGLPVRAEFVASGPDPEHELVPVFRPYSEQAAR